MPGLRMADLGRAWELPLGSVTAGHQNSVQLLFKGSIVWSHKGCMLTLQQTKGPLRTPACLNRQRVRKLHGKAKQRGCGQRISLPRSNVEIRRVSAKPKLRWSYHLQGGPRAPEWWRAGVDLSEVLFVLSASFFTHKVPQPLVLWSWILEENKQQWMWIMSGDTWMSSDITSPQNWWGCIQGCWERKPMSWWGHSVLSLHVHGGQGNSLMTWQSVVHASFKKAQRMNWGTRGCSASLWWGVCHRTSLRGSISVCLKEKMMDESCVAHDWPSSLLSKVKGLHLLIREEQCVSFPWTSLGLSTPFPTISLSPC